MKEQEFLKLAYAAYGSNLHLKQMEVRCPTAECIGKGYLEDYQLVFGKRGFLDVVPCPGQKVQVGLFKVTDTVAFVLIFLMNLVTGRNMKNIRSYMIVLPFLSKPYQRRRYRLLSIR